MDVVEYRELPEYPHYRVGSDGSVWSCNAGNKTRSTREWRRMKPSTQQLGHQYVHLKINMQPVKMYIHRMVAMAFLGPIPQGYEVCHNDGIPSNNVPSNLRFDTRWGNLNDRRKHGTMNCGTRQGHAKLDDEAITAIFYKYAKGDQLKGIAMHYGVDSTTIKAVVKRMTWRHIAINPSTLTAVQYRLRHKTVFRSIDHESRSPSPIVHP